MAYNRKQNHVSAEEGNDAEFNELKDFSFNDRPARRAAGGYGWKILIIIIAVAVVAGGSWLAFDRYFWRGGDKNEASAVKTTEWQAVFLANGQVYFGKFAKLSDKEIVLTNIYYLQVIPVDQASETAANPTGKDSQQLKLVKLGGELHGPSDEMVINKAYVLLTESLRSDSGVVKSINEYIAGQKK